MPSRKRLWGNDAKCPGAPPDHFDRLVRASPRSRVVVACSDVRSRVRCSARAGDRAPTSSTRFVGAIEHRRDKGPRDGTSLLGRPALPRDRTAETTGSCRSARPGTVWLVVATIQVGDRVFTDSFHPIEQWAWIAFTLGVIAFTYWGLRRRRPWVVPLIIFGWPYVVLPCVPDWLQSSSGLIISHVWQGFWIYQLWFLAQPETQTLFRVDKAEVLSRSG